MEELFTGVGSLHKSQDDYINGGADLFSTAPTDKSTLFSNESIYRVTNDNPLGPFHFHIPSEGDSYIDPQSFRLSGYTQIKRYAENGQLVDLTVDSGTGTEQVVGDKVAPINFLPGMAFQTKELSINGVAVNYATQPMENFKAYVENLLSYGSEIKSTILKATANWIPDADTDGVENVGKGSDSAQWKVRKKMWEKSKRVGFSIPLQLDVLTTDRFFPKNMDLNIKLTKAQDSLLYIATDNSRQYRVLFHDLKLHVNRITMTEPLILDHERRFRAGQLASFPYIRTDVMYKNIPTGSSSFQTQNIFRTKLPNSCIVFFVNQEALTGSALKDPLNFEHFDVAKLVCLRNSQEFPPGGYTQDYGSNDYVETYRRCMDEIGIRTNNLGNNITSEMYKRGCNFYAFDFSPDKCNGFHDHITIGGAMDFSVVFKKATTEAISMVIMSHYEDKLQIDEARNVANRGEPTALPLK